MRAGQQHAMIWLSSAKRQLAKLSRGEDALRAGLQSADAGQTEPIDLRQLQRPTACLDWSQISDVAPPHVSVLGAVIADAGGRVRLSRVA